MILVRSPFERVVSAYNDKMKIDSPGFTPTGFEPISRGIREGYCKFRANETERSMIGDGTATFEDFVNFLVRLRSPSEFDSHWMQFEHVCDPCNAGYDVIMKFDTYQDDFRYIKEFLNVSSNHFSAFFPSKTNDSVTEAL